jgi:hypothetical protein
VRPAALHPQVRGRLERGKGGTRGRGDRERRGVGAQRKQRWLTDGRSGGRHRAGGGGRCALGFNPNHACARPSRPQQAWAGGPPARAPRTPALLASWTQSSGGPKLRWLGPPPSYLYLFSRILILVEIYIPTPRL